MSCESGRGVLGPAQSCGQTSMNGIFVGGDFSSIGLWEHTAFWESPAIFVENPNDGTASIDGVLEQNGTRWQIQIHLSGSEQISPSLDVFDEDEIGEFKICNGFSTNGWIIYPGISGNITRLDDQKVFDLARFDHHGAQVGAYANTWNEHNGVGMWLAASSSQSERIPVEFFGDLVCSPLPATTAPVPVCEGDGQERVLVPAQSCGGTFLNNIYVRGDFRSIGLWKYTAYWETSPVFVENSNDGTASINGVLEQDGIKWQVQIELSGSKQISPLLDVFDEDEIGVSKICSGFSTDGWLIYPGISGNITRLDSQQTFSLERYDHHGAQLGAYANSWNENYGLGMWMVASSSKGERTPVEFFADVICRQLPTTSVSDLVLCTVVSN